MLLGPRCDPRPAGFRGDGSFVNQRGNEIYAPQRTSDRARMMDNFYPPGGTEVDARQIAALEQLAMLGRERGVTLVAI